MLFQTQKVFYIYNVNVYICVCVCVIAILSVLLTPVYMTLVHIVS